MKKTTMTLMALALTASVATAQEKVAAKPAPATPAPAPAAQAAPVKDTDVVVSAGSVAITKAEYESIVKSLPEQYQQMAMGQGKRQFAENLLRMRLLAQQAAKNGLDKDVDVQRQMAMARENILASAEFARIDKSTKVPEADLKAYYEKEKGSYEQVHARHILVAFDGSPALPEGKKMTDAEAKAKADALRAKIAAGAKFEDVAKTDSDDAGSKDTGGDLGAFGRGQMVKEFETAAFAAKPGEVTPVVKSQFGYHIIKVESHDYTPFEQVKARIEKDLHQQKVQEAIEAVNKANTTQFNTAYFPPPPAAEANDAAPVSTPKKQ